jgi:hypothetical protein
VTKTTISVNKETRERLEDVRQSQRGARNESLDSVINRALDALDQKGE